MYVCMKLYVICVVSVFFAMEVSNTCKRRQYFNAIYTAIPIPSASLDILE